MLCVAGIGAVAGKFSNREAILLRVGLAFGSL
jgi:hypothetical protein